MPKNMNKRRNTSMLKSTVTFRKKKIKVGRRLPRQNATNTSFQSKKITINEQMSYDDEEPKGGDPSSSSTIGHSNLKQLGELTAQLGHYNENIARDAIAGVRKHFKDFPELTRRHLHVVVPGIGALLNRELKQTATRNQLKRLLEQICELPAQLMRSHFHLLSQHVLTGLADIRPAIRQLAFDVLLLLMKRYPEQCEGSRQIFEQFLQLITAERQPTGSRPKLLEAMHQFLAIFSRTVDPSLWPQVELNFSFASPAANPKGIRLRPLPGVAFHFPVLYADNSFSDIGGGQSQSPMLQSADGIVGCCRTFCTLLAAAIHEEKSVTDSRFNSTMTKIYNIVSQLADTALHFVDNQLADMDGSVRRQLTSAFAPLKKCPLIGCSKKMAQKLDAIEKSGSAK